MDDLGGKPTIFGNTHMVLMRAVGDWSLQENRRVFRWCFYYIYILVLSFEVFLELVDMGIVWEMYRQAFFV